MREIQSLLIAMFLLVSVHAFADKAPVGSAMRAIQDLDTKLDDYKTGANLSEADKEFNRQLKKDIIHGTFDIRELSRVSLGKHWNDRTDKERDDFVQLLTDLLENKAILSKEQGKKKSKSQAVYQIAYKAEKFINEDKSRSFVKTSVYVKSEDVRVALNYKLKKEGTGWRIYDVIVDDASLVDNYKFQFDSIIKKSGYPDLVRRMQNKLTEIKNKKGD